MPSTRDEYCSCYFYAIYQVPLLALNDIIQTFAGPRSSMESFIKERCFVQSKLRTGILLQRKVIPIPLVQSKLKSLPMAVLIWIYLKMKQGVCCLCCCKRRRGRNHRKKTDEVTGQIPVAEFIQAYEQYSLRRSKPVEVRHTVARWLSVRCMYRRCH